MSVEYIPILDISSVMAEVEVLFFLIMLFYLKITNLEQFHNKILSRSLQKHFEAYLMYNFR
jgi:hypothetical protein